MKCISHSTLGVLIGILNIVVYSTASIGCIIRLVTINDEARFNRIHRDNGYHQDLLSSYDTLKPYDKQIKYMPHRVEIIDGYTITVHNIILSTLFIACLIMVLMSSLMVLGIRKNRHGLMAPWIIFNTIGFFCECVTGLVLLFTSIAAAIALSIIFYKFMIFCLVLGIQAMILYAIYTLYRDIRNNNLESPRQTIVTGNVSFTNDYPEQVTYYAQT